MRRRGGIRALIAALALAAALLPACGGGGSTAGGGRPVNGGTLDIGILTPPSSLDPEAGTSGGDYPYLYLMFDRLITFDLASGKLEPGLATDWKFSGLDFTLNLRKGVTFQDGTPVDANAVKFSLDRFIQLGDIPAELGAVRDVEVTGAYSLTVHLERPYSALPAVLADRAGMIVSPSAVRKYGKDFANHPVGAGPYRFVSQVSNASVTLARYAGYWRKGFPHLDRVVWKLFSNDTALVNAVRSGDVNVALGVLPFDAAPLKGDNRLVVSYGPNLGFNMIYLNTTVPPMDSTDVRLAMNYAIDRAALVQVGTNGTGQPSWSVLPPGSPCHPRSVDREYAFNPAKARQLMAQAGRASVSMTCLTFPGIGYESVGPVIQQQLRAVGIGITIKQESLPQSVVDFYEKQTAPCFLSAWSGRPDPELTIASLFGSQSYYNAGHGNLGVDDLIAKLNDTYEQPARAQVIDDIFKRLAPEASYVPLYSAPMIVVFQRNVGGYQPSFQGKEDFSSLFLTSS
jgi:peptide/nickel transport system substrate-binding protein